MKKIYKSLSLIAFVAVCNSAMAQAPTITTVAMPQVGYTYFMTSDTVAADRATFTVSAGSASAQTWNYSTNYVTTFPDTTTFLAKSAGAGNANFPGATMCSPSGGAWAYWTTGGGLLLDGFYGDLSGTGSPVAVDLVPNMMQIPMPFTYGGTSSTNSAATFTLTVSGFPATVNHRVIRTITADAFGSLTTPLATYPNTLRVKIYDITSDSVSMFGSFVQAQYDTTTQYSWFQNSANANLMEINLNRAGVVTKASHLQLFSNGVVTVSQPSTSLNVYPNPATDMAYFTYQNKTSGMVTLTLVDVTGKQIAVLVNEQQSVGAQKVAINVAALHMPKGLYFLQLNSNNSLQTTKLNVN